MADICDWHDPGTDIRCTREAVSYISRYGLDMKLCREHAEAEAVEWWDDIELRSAMLAVCLAAQNVVMYGGVDNERTLSLAVHMWAPAFGDWMARHQ